MLGGVKGVSYIYNMLAINDQNMNDIENQTKEETGVDCSYNSNILVIEENIPIAKNNYNNNSMAYRAADEAYERLEVGQSALLPEGARHDLVRLKIDNKVKQEREARAADGLGDKKYSLRREKGREGFYRIHRIA